MAFFEELSRKAKDMAAVAADKAKDVAAVAADKARETTEKTKISVAIAGEQREIEKNYRMIGEWFINEYEGELPEGAQAAEQPDETTSDTPQTPAPEEPSSDAAKKAQTVLASMTQDEKLWQLFFVTPEALTNVNTATVAGETTKNALQTYPVGGTSRLLSMMASNSFVGIICW